MKKKIKTEGTTSFKNNTEMSWLKSSECLQHPIYVVKLKKPRTKKSCSIKKSKTESKTDKKPYKDSFLCEFHKNCEKGQRLKTHEYFQNYNDYDQKMTKAENKGEKITIDQLRIQNIELMEKNEHLLYEKEYLKQKLTLRDVECRQLQRKLDEAHTILM